MTWVQGIVVGVAVVAILAYLGAFFWYLLDPAHKRDQLRDQIRRNLELDLPARCVHGVWLWEHCRGCEGEA